MTWHVALVLGGDEQKAMLRLAAGSVGSMWPRWTERISVLGRVREVSRPLASGYLLVDFDGRDAHAWHRVRALCGCYGYIGGEIPTEVPPAAIQKLLDRCLTDDGLMAPPEPGAVRGLLRPGDKVVCRFADDSLFYPWTGQHATVKWDDNRGVSIALSMLGRETSLYVPYPEALALDAQMMPRKRSIYGRRRASAMIMRA